MITIYWAARLFNQAEKIWNRKCTELLSKKDDQYNIILPQDDAEKFKREDGSYDLDALAKDCMKNSMECDVGIYNLDGPDVDSGTSVEAGGKIAIKKKTGKGLALGVRTDFRGTSEDKKTGVNAMFRELDDIISSVKDEDVEALVDLIHGRIQKWIREGC